jgi:hypothetical protein
MKLFYVGVILFALGIVCIYCSLDSIPAGSGISVASLRKGEKGQIQVMIPKDSLINTSNFFLECDGQIPVHLGEKFLFRGEEMESKFGSQVIYWKPLLGKDTLLKEKIDDGVLFRKGKVVKIIKYTQIKNSKK